MTVLFDRVMTAKKTNIILYREYKEKQQFPFNSPYPHNVEALRHPTLVGSNANNVFGFKEGEKITLHNILYNTIKKFKKIIFNNIEGEKNE